MSDDIDRLKTILEGIAQTNDELKDLHDVMRDVVEKVTPVELETDPEGHGALRDIAGDILLASTLLQKRTVEVGALVEELEIKAVRP